MSGETPRGLSLERTKVGRSWVALAYLEVPIRLAWPWMDGMARNDAMRDPFLAPVLLRIETVLHETDREAQGHGLTLTDSAVRSVVVRAVNEARGKPAKVAAVSPKDRLLADAVARLAAMRTDLLVVEDGGGQAERVETAAPLSVADWLLALDAVKQSCETRTTSEPGSRGYLDFLGGFLRDAMDPAQRPSA